MVSERWKKLKKGTIKTEIGSYKYKYKGNGSAANLITEALAIAGFDIVTSPVFKDYTQIGEKVVIYSNR